MENQRDSACIVSSVELSPPVSVWAQAIGSHPKPGELHKKLGLSQSDPLKSSGPAIMTSC